MKKFNVILLILMATVFCLSCRGPQGPPGNANVASSNITVRSSDWYWQDPSWRVDLDFNAITPAINDHGAVLVYMKVSNTWRQLPMTYFYSEIDNNNDEHFYASTIEVSYYDKGVSLFWTESDLSNIGAPNNAEFKVVVIDALYYSAHPEINYADYEVVKTMFKLAD